MTDQTTSTADAPTTCRPLTTTTPDGTPVTARVQWASGHDPTPQAEAAVEAIVHATTARLAANPTTPTTTGD